MGQHTRTVLAIALLSACSLVIAQQTCSDDIAPCAASRCASQTINGQAAVKVCLRCSGLYQPSKNALNCICPAGHYERCTTSGGNRTCACQPCERGFYCPGGNRLAMNGNMVNRGRRFSCHRSQENPMHTTATVEALGLTTKSEKSVRHIQCFPMPGYYLPALSAADQAAVLCPKDKYSRGYARLRQCLKCQSGLEEDPSFTDAAGGAAPNAGAYYLGPPATFQDSTGETVSRNITQLRANRTDVCKVPAGKYITSGAVRLCPLGTWRSGYLGATDSAASYCNSCPGGVRTESVGSTSQAACVLGMAGYDISMEVDPETNQTISRMCPRGTYYAGGLLPGNATTTCSRCPLGTDTQNEGSTSITDCKVPPGYFIRMKGEELDLSITGPDDGELVKCPTNEANQGYYRDGWASWTDGSVRQPASGSGAGACKGCGPGILSEWTEIDEKNGEDNVEGTNTVTTSRVATSPQSCYIEPGMGTRIHTHDTGYNAGMYIPTYSGYVCPNNTYGVSERVWGVAFVPCKPCGRNLISPEGSTSMDNCTNPAGWSFESGQAVQCPAGFYNSEGSKKTCMACPEGRTTDVQDAADNQNEIDDCYVKPGYGLYDVQVNSWIVDNPESIPVNSTDFVAAPCPVGYYGRGGGYMDGDTMVINTLCMQCDLGHTTDGTATTVDTSLASNLWGTLAGACKVCVNGYGKVDNNGVESCTKCGYGTYYSGDAWGSAGNCETCPKTTFTFLANREPVDPVTVSGITLVAGATREEECVPSEQQFSEDVGAALFPDSLYTTAAGSGFGGISTVSTLANCKAACDSITKACFYEYRYHTTTSNCRVLQLSLADDYATPALTLNEGGSRSLVYVKLLPSSMAAVASIDSGLDSGVRQKTLTSGFYARLEYQSLMEGMNAELGVELESLTIAANRDLWIGADTGACKEACDIRGECWGFTLKYESDQWSRCSLRTGTPTRNARPFFKLPDPDMVDLESYQMWLA